MRTLRQIIMDDMTEQEREHYDALRLKRRVVTANYIALATEIDDQLQKILDDHRKKLGIS
jgi:hypothetical protein